MPSFVIDHVNIRTSNLKAMIDWYGRVFDMVAGPRPDFGVPGAWLYLGDAAVVHLAQALDDIGADPAGAFQLEHFGLRGNSWLELEKRLLKEGVAYRVQEIEQLGILQCMIRDPDHNDIRIDFPLPRSDVDFPMLVT